MAFFQATKTTLTPPSAVTTGEPGLLRARAFAVRLLWLPSECAWATLALHGPLGELKVFFELV